MENASVSVTGPDKDRDQEHAGLGGGTCIVCTEPKERGIRIYGQFVCEECERDIVRTDVEDEKYHYYIERMKQIWLAAIS
ncbi:MAG TPA: sigma factor G inhibitor Gin [Bacilli bacterium]|nr:sigma factor G inhibitor Gin [Bacilli bacterium]